MLSQNWQILTSSPHFVVFLEQVKLAMFDPPPPYRDDIVYGQNHEFETILFQVGILKSCEKQ